MSDTVPKTKGYLLADPCYANAWRVRHLWRPLFALVFILFFAALALTVLLLLAMGLAQLGDASSLLIAMIGTGGAVTGAHTIECRNRHRDTVQFYKQVRGARVRAGQ